MRRRSMCVLFTAWLSLLTASSSARGAETFLEVEGNLAADPLREGVVLFEVLRAFRFEGSRLVLERGALTVTCESAASPSAATTIAPGQVLTLNWDVARKRGKVLGKSGRQARLAVPREGWMVRCGRGGAQRLYGAFVTGRGLTPDLHYAAKRGSVWSRMGLKRARGPQLPEVARIRLAWSPDIAMASDVAAASRAGSRR